MYEQTHLFFLTGRERLTLAKGRVEIMRVLMVGSGGVGTAAALIDQIVR